ncbi:hypothetical protein D3C84_623150 [compost metagenome]
MPVATPGAIASPAYRYRHPASGPMVDRQATAPRLASGRRASAPIYSAIWLRDFRLHRSIKHYGERLLHSSSTLETSALSLHSIEPPAVCPVPAQVLQEPFARSRPAPVASDAPDASSRANPFRERHSSHRRRLVDRRKSALARIPARTTQGKGCPRPGARNPKVAQVMIRHRTTASLPYPAGKRATACQAKVKTQAAGGAVQEEAFYPV